MPAHRRAMAPSVHINDARLLPGGEDREDSGADDGKKAQQPPHRSAILVTVSMFMGYAALVVLQHKLKGL